MTIRKNKHQPTSSTFRGAAIKTGRLGLLKKTAKFSAVALLLVGGAFATAGQDSVKAAACLAPTADLGTLSGLTFNVPTTGEYTVWTRMLAPDAANNSINLQVDQDTCYNVGGGSFAASAWTADSANWVNYANGAPSTPVRMTFSAGEHTLKYIGSKAGVQVDQIFITSDTAKIPTGTCEDCMVSGDSTPPTVNFQPSSTEPILGEFELTATAADESGIAQVAFLVDGQVVNVDTTEPYSFNWLSTTVANGTHKLQAIATDTQGNPAPSPEVTVTTQNTVICTGNPAVPANVRVTGKTGSSIAIAWDASTPAEYCQIKEYGIYRDGTAVTTVASGTTFNDTGLTPGSSHSYTITAIDSTGHTSAQSAAAQGETSTDSVKPSVPAGLTKSLASSSSVALSWTASTDNTAVESYIIYRNGTEVGTSPSNAYTDTGVQPNTQYTYTVAAKDAAGNVSEQSAALTVQTLDGPAGGQGKMYITPATGSYTIGQDITVAIRADSGTVGVNTASADIAYPASLQFVAFDLAESAYSGGCPQKSGENGLVSIGCFIPAVNGQETVPLTGDKLLAKVTFKVLAAGNAVLDLKDSSVLIGAATATDVLTAREDANYTLQAATTPVTPPAPTPPAPTPTPPTPTTPRPTTPSTSRPSTGGGTSGGSSTGTAPITTTTIAPEGNAQPITLPNDTEVELSDPVVVQTVPDSSQSVTKVEYYLNGKLIASIKEPPYSYSVNTKNMKNGTYKLTTRTYYEDGTVDTKDASLVVKNPMSFKQIMLQLGGLIWVILLVLIMAVAGVWYFFFRNRNSGGDDYDGDDGYMFGPTGSGPVGPMGPNDPMVGPPSYGPPPPPAGPYSGADMVAPASPMQQSPMSFSPNDIPAGRY